MSKESEHDKKVEELMNVPLIELIERLIKAEDELSEVERLTDQILKIFPKFFGNFDGWEFGNGTSADKHFKSIYNRAKRFDVVKRKNSGDEYLPEFD